MITDSDTLHTIVFETNSQEQLSNCSLVLSALHITHTISRNDANHIILVSEADGAAAKHHIDEYLKENRNWPPQKDFQEQSSSSIQPPTLLVVGSLMLFFYITGPWSEHSLWFSNGAGDATAILTHGEYYRLVTALTLHADITHLLGNCFLGGFLIHFFCRTTGPGIGIFTILLSAAMGNFINVYLHGGNHLFVGFSTAVFSTIGMLVMISYHANKRLTSYQVFIPFMAGVALLAMTGSSGERTDLGAHFFGLLSGFVFGRLLTTNTVMRYRSSSMIQLFLFLLTVVFVYISWEKAMVVVY